MTHHASNSIGINAARLLQSYVAISDIPSRSKRCTTRHSLSHATPATMPGMSGDEKPTVVFWIVVVLTAIFGMAVSAGALWLFDLVPFTTHDRPQETRRGVLGDRG